MLQHPYSNPLVCVGIMRTAWDSCLGVPPECSTAVGSDHLGSLLVSLPHPEGGFQSIVPALISLLFLTALSLPHTELNGTGKWSCCLPLHTQGLDASVTWLSVLLVWTILPLLIQIILTFLARLLSAINFSLSPKSTFSGLPSAF